MSGSADGEYKVRVKHLTEENTSESVKGEMIVSQVTGHISVKDLYFVNSATKDIEARDKALNNFHKDLLNDINYLNMNSINFNNAVNRFNKTTKPQQVNDPNEMLTEINLIFNTISDFENQNIQFIEEYTKLEKQVKQIELKCRRFQNMYQYILKQRHVYHESYSVLEHDYKINMDLYEKNIAEFRRELLRKYKNLLLNSNHEGLKNIKFNITNLYGDETFEITKLYERKIDEIDL